MQNVLTDLFNTPVVPASSDVFLEDAMLAGPGLSDTLVISRPYPSPGSEETQLLRLLGACKLAESDYRIVTLGEDQKVAWHRLREQTQASKILLLGVPPLQLGINALMVPHEINHFNGGIWIPTVSLQELSNSPQLKQHLWQQVLQPLYIKG